MQLATRILGRHGSIQIGEQATIGTAVACPTELYAEGSTFQHQQMKAIFEDTDGGGGRAGSYIPPVITSNMVTFQRNAPLDLNAILFELHGLFGAVAGQPTTPASATNTRQWEYESDPQAAAPPTLYTLRCVERDSESPISNYVVQAQDVFLQSFEINYEANAVPTLSSTWMGNNPLYAQTYAAGTLITPLIQPTKLATVRIDDDWVTMIGSSPTQELDVYSAQITVNTGRFAPSRMHGLSHLGYDATDQNKVVVDLTLGVYFGTAATDLTREERAHMDASDKRFVSVRIAGTELIETGQPHVPELVLGGCFYHQETSMDTRGNVDGDGMMTGNIVLRSTFDDTSSHDIYAKLVNEQTQWTP